MTATELPPTDDERFAAGESPDSGGGCATVFVYLAAGLASLLLLALCAGSISLYFFEDQVEAFLGGTTATSLPAGMQTAAAATGAAPSVTAGAPATAAALTLAPTAAAIATNAAGSGSTATPGLLPTLAPTNTPRPLPPPVTVAPRDPITLLVWTACDEGNVAQFTRNARITFEWDWAGQLAPGEFLEVRVGPRGSANLGGIGGQVDPSLREGTRYRWPLQAGLFFIEGVQDYEWQAAYIGADGSPKTTSGRGCIRIN